MDNTYKLKYIVEGNAAGMRPVRQELEKTDKAITKLGSGKGLSSLASSLSGVATGSQLNGLTSQLTSASGALSAIPGPAGLAVGAIALLGTVSVGAIAGLYGLAKAASDYGSEIFDASEKTGLSAETLSSFKLAADQSSSSLEQVTAGVTKFSKTVGEAALGSEEATAKLKRLGVEPQAAMKDLDGALATVFKRIVALPPGVTQSKAAMDAFGKSGADLLPFIKSFNGDLPALIAKCKELGIVLTDKDARAADEFGDQMDTLTAQLKMVGVTFGRELMPVFLKGSKDISDWLSKNKGEIKSWGGVASSVLGEVAREIGFLAFVAKKTKDAINEFLGDITIGGIPVGKIFQASQIPNSILQAGQFAGKAAGQSVPGPDSDYLDNLDAKKDAADKARKERLERAKRDNAAMIAIEQMYVKDVEAIYAASLALAENDLKGGGRITDYKKAVLDANDWLETETKKSFDKISALENLAADRDQKSAVEQEALQKQQADRRLDIEKKKGKAIADADEKAQAESKQRQSAGYAEASARIAAEYDRRQAEADLAHETALTSELDYQKARNKIILDELTAERDAMILHGKSVAEIEIQNTKIRTAGIRAQQSERAAEIKDAKDAADALKKKADAIQELADAIDELDAANRKLKAEDKARRTVGSSTAVSAMGELHEMFVSDQNTAAIAGVEALTSAFDGLGQAVGAAVSAYVLYGSAGASVRQVTAQILAGIAQQAAVKAIFELAEGFAMLALAIFGHPTAGPSATAHFTAAAIYGSMAGIAALAGRAVAGDSFKKDGESGQSASNSGTSRGRSSENLTPYSRQNENTFVSGRSDTAAAIGGLRDEVRALHQKIGSSSPGDVLVRAMRQKPSAVPNQVMKYNQRNPTPFRTALKQSKIR